MIGLLYEIYSRNYLFMLSAAVCCASCSWCAVSSGSAYYAPLATTVVA